MSLLHNRRRNNNSNKVVDSHHPTNPIQPYQYSASSSSTTKNTQQQQMMMKPIGGSGSSPTTLYFNNAPFWRAQQVFVGMNVLGFVISLATGSHIHLDLLGTGAFAVAAVVPLFLQNNKNNKMMMMQPHRIQASSAAVFFWGTKLAAFLFYRALQVKRDGRLHDTLSSVSGTAGFWLLSLLWGVVCSLPHTLGTTSSLSGNPRWLRLGGVLYVMGIAIETLADYQKWQFKQQQQHSNSGSSFFCNVGLWSVSQHPNFFGNLLLWTGIWTMNASALIIMNGKQLENISWMQRYGRLALSLLSPMFMWGLFYGQANGYITNAVVMAQAKYGSDPAYQEYVRTVPKIVPNLFSFLFSGKK